MNLNEYQDLASRTARTDLSQEGALCNWAMGLCGESGEHCEIIKKHVFHGKDLNKEQAIIELGDALFYLANSARQLGVKLEYVAQANIDKLSHRYPNGFVPGGGIR